MIEISLEELVKEEGNHLEWTNSFACSIRRNSMDVWCGYVTIPKSFPIKIDQNQLNCHGGITYEEVDINGNTTFGFDTGHHMDISPKLQHLYGFKQENASYKTKQYAIDEVNYLVSQIIDLSIDKRISAINSILNN